MDFGIALDEVQRHCLEDSDEEEDESDDQQRDIFSCPDSGQRVKTLILAIGQHACILVKSHLNLEPSPSFVFEAESLTVFQDKCFSPASQEKGIAVSTGFTAKCTPVADTGQFFVCAHEQQLTSQHCNLWCSKVSKRGLSSIY